MDELPAPLLAEILTRLSDSSDHARCRAVSKSLNAASRDTRTLSHLCTAARYHASRRRSATADAQLSFKPAFVALVRSCTCLESVSIAVDKPLGRLSYDDAEDDGDDLYLTDAGFLEEWLPAVAAAGLRSLAISDFWSQSSWRKSQALATISSFCNNLLELELKNTWLSVDGLNPMPKLKRLTLEFIRLDDEDLNRVNDCFPGLEVFNFIGVGGLKDPKINLSNLKTCHCAISNAPNSLTILAPNLVGLKIKCVRPRSLVLETPSLTDLCLAIEKSTEVKVKGFPCLRRLQLVSRDLRTIVGMFRSSRSLEVLMVEKLKSDGPDYPKLSLEAFDLFPNLSFLEVGPGAWSEMEASFGVEGSASTGVALNGLKEIKARFAVSEIETTLSFIAYILDRYSNVSEIGLRVHHEVDPSTFSQLLSKSRANWPRVNWKWELWK